MARAGSHDTTVAPAAASQPFAALSAAVQPAWHQAILRLANSLEGVSSKIDQVRECQDAKGNFVSRCRALVTTLIDVLDELDADPDLEPTFGGSDRGYGPMADECEPPEDGKPSLGSPDRITDQTRWCAGSKDDLELDDCDREADDPNEAKLRPAVMA